MTSINDLFSEGEKKERAEVCLRRVELYPGQEESGFIVELRPDDF